MASKLYCYITNDMRGHKVKNDPNYLNQLIFGVRTLPFGLGPEGERSETFIWTENVRRVSNFLSVPRHIFPFVTCRLGQGLSMKRRAKPNGNSPLRRPAVLNKTNKTAACD